MKRYSRVELVAFLRRRDVAHARRATELTPLAWWAHFRRGIALAAVSQVDDAITECAIASVLASNEDEG